MIKEKSTALNSKFKNELNANIIDAIQDIKGKNIVIIDLKSIGEAPTDYFIVCEGESTTQVKAIADNIEKKIKENLSTFPSHVEGAQHANWILVDYFNTVVHVFHPEARAFYEIEDLWSDGEIIDVENI